MAFQRACRSRLASDLCRDAAHAGGAAGADQQDRPQRCARHGPDDAGGTLSPGACEDAPQSETANAADPSQTAAVQGHRHRFTPSSSLSVSSMMLDSSQNCFLLVGADFLANGRSCASFSSGPIWLARLKNLT